MLFPELWAITESSAALDTSLYSHQHTWSIPRTIPPQGAAATVTVTATAKPAGGRISAKSALSGYVNVDGGGTGVEVFANADISAGQPTVTTTRTVTLTPRGGGPPFVRIGVQDGPSVRFNYRIVTAPPPLPPPPPPPAPPACSLAARAEIRQVPATPACKTEEDKRRWTQLALYHNEKAAEWAIGAGIIAGIAVIPGNQIVGGAGAAFFATMSAMHWKLNAVYSRWANDPPDPDFRMIAPPETIRVQTVRATRGISRSAAAA